MTDRHGMTITARARHIYLLALGSNRALSGRLGPRALLSVAVDRIAASAGKVIATSPTIETPPMGPASRRFVNGAALIASDLEPTALLERLHAIERSLGRRRARRWGDRRIDIDIILWSGGIVRRRHLTIPHPGFRRRAFVLRPAAAILPHGRDPASGLSLRHLLSRLERRRPGG